MTVWPADPEKSLGMNELLWAAMDDLMKKGLVKDYGIFPDGASGFLVCEGETANVYAAVNMFIPFVSSDVNEIISYEKQKETVRALSKLAIAAMKK